MNRRLLALLVCLLLALFTEQAVADGRRVALVIGVGAYSAVPMLPNARSDAVAMGELFRKAGFETVTTKSDVGNLEFKRALRDFEEVAGGADIAVIFYAGHGIEVRDQNYLLPNDAKLVNERDIDDEAIALERLIAAVEPAKRLRLIILDACRDNPFLSKMRRRVSTRAISAGLGKIEPPQTDTLIAYAAKQNAVAYDGVGENSPFTSALLANITTPGLDIRIAFGRVRDEVLKATGGVQEPFVYGSLGGSTVALVPAPAHVPETAGDLSAKAKTDYELVERLGDKEAWKVYLSTYKIGMYADLARIQLAKLEEADPVSRNDASRYPQDMPVPKGPSPGPTLAPPPRPTAQEQKAWDKLKTSTDVNAIQRFVDQHPTSPLAVEAHQRINELNLLESERERAKRAAKEAAVQREIEDRQRREEEAERKRLDREAARQREAEERAKAAEIARQKAAEQAALRKREAEEKARLAEEAARKREEAERQKAAEIAARQKEAEERAKAAEAERRRAEAEAAERRRQREMAEQEAAAAKAIREAEARKREEEERAKAAEIARQQAAEQAALRKREAEEKARLAEEAARKREEAERQKAAEIAARQKEAEERTKAAEAEKRRTEEDAAEQNRQRELAEQEAAAAKATQEAAARKREAEERAKAAEIARQQAAEQAALRKREAEEKARLAEEAERQKATEIAARQKEAEKRAKAAEAERRQAEEEAADRRREAAIRAKALAAEQAKAQQKIEQERRKAREAAAAAAARQEEQAAAVKRRQAAEKARAEAEEVAAVKRRKAAEASRRAAEKQSERAAAIAEQKRRLARQREEVRHAQPRQAPVSRPQARAQEPSPRSSGGGGGGGSTMMGIGF